MIDHIGIDVSDFVRARQFYTPVLATLGITIIVEVSADVSAGVAAGQTCVGMGYGGRPFFWYGKADGQRNSGQIHLAFCASSRQMVDEFHKVALGLGGIDNGKPGLRPQYHDHYYAAFVLDPDSNNLEAVCHTHPEGNAA